MGCREMKEGCGLLRAESPGGSAILQVSRAQLNDVGPRMFFLSGAPSVFPFFNKQQTLSAPNPPPSDNSRPHFLPSPRTKPGFSESSKQRLAARGGSPVLPAISFHPFPLAPPPFCAPSPAAAAFIRDSAAVGPAIHPVRQQLGGQTKSSFGWMRVPADRKCEGSALPPAAHPAPPSA